MQKKNDNKIVKKQQLARHVKTLCGAFCPNNTSKVGKWVSKLVKHGVFLSFSPIRGVSWSNNVFSCLCQQDSCNRLNGQLTGGVFL